MTSCVVCVVRPENNNLDISAHPVNSTGFPYKICIQNCSTSTPRFLSTLYVFPGHSLQSASTENKINLGCTLQRLPVRLVFSWALKKDSCILLYCGVWMWVVDVDFGGAVLERGVMDLGWWGELKRLGPWRITWYGEQLIALAGSWRTHGGPYSTRGVPRCIMYEL